VFFINTTHLLVSNGKPLEMVKFNPNTREK